MTDITVTTLWLLVIVDKLCYQFIINYASASSHSDVTFPIIWRVHIQEEEKDIAINIFTDILS